MDDEQLGNKLSAIHCRLSRSSVLDWTEVARHARALLAKPEATPEAVEAYLTKRDGYAPSMERVKSHIAALSHFAPPARPKTMIEGMSVEQIKHRMFDALPGLLDGIQQATARDCAIEAYRLANTPAPEGDPDEEAKSFIEELRNYGFKWHGTVTPYWDDGPEEMRTFARKVVASRAAAAAKKEAGGE